MSFEVELTNLITRVPNLGRRNNNKFADVEQFLLERIGATTAIAYLSDVRKQFAARVGQTLVATPDVIILLASGGGWEPYLPRLDAIAQYAEGLGAFSLWTETDGVWEPRYLVGNSKSRFLQALAVALPSAHRFPEH